MIHSVTAKKWGLIAMTLLFSCRISIAQRTEWIQVDPGGNGWLTTSAMHPVSGDLYFSTDMRFSLFRSTDLGDTWDPVANVVPGTFNCIVGHPSDENITFGHQVGFIPESSGIWMSRDKGDTWEMIYQSVLFGTGKGESGVIHPGNTDIMYWTAEDGGIMKSEDGGRSWKDWSKGLPKSELVKERHLNAMEIDRENRVYYPSSMGLYFLAHGSDRWKLVKGGLPQSNCTDIQLTCCNILYAAFPSYGLFRSLNNGRKWTLMTNGLDGKSCFRAVSTVSNPDIVYVVLSKLIPKTVHSMLKTLYFHYFKRPAKQLHKNIYYYEIFSFRIYYFDLLHRTRQRTGTAWRFPGFYPISASDCMYGLRRRHRSHAKQAFFNNDSPGADKFVRILGIHS